MIPSKGTITTHRAVRNAEFVGVVVRSPDICK